MQTGALARLIWQQRAPDAAQMMAALLQSRARDAIENIQLEFVGRILRHPLTTKYMQASPALLRCARALLDACDDSGAEMDDDLANFVAEATSAKSQSWLFVRATLVAACVAC